MTIKENCSLAAYTTIKLGGQCERLYFPETRDELIEVLLKVPDCKIMGGGSNLLINDQVIFKNVLCLRNLEKKQIEINGDTVTVSSGVRLQKLIKMINEHGLGGIEYLYSVPGLVGGAIYMNAGRGRGANKQISDYLSSVDVLENGKIETYTKKQCGFDYRTSVFQNKECVILSAVFRFEPVSPEEGMCRQKERLTTCKQFQDNSYPNAGTFCCQADPRIMNFLKKTAPKKQAGVQFSRKANNWLQNRGNGTYAQVIKKIKLTKRLHSLFGKPCKVEYIIWDK